MNLKFCFQLLKNPSHQPMKSLKKCLFLDFLPSANEDKEGIEIVLKIAGNDTLLKALNSFS